MGLPLPRAAWVLRGKTLYHARFEALQSSDILPLRTRYPIPVFCNPSFSPYKDHRRRHTALHGTLQHITSSLGALHIQHPTDHSLPRRCKAALSAFRIRESLQRQFQLVMPKLDGTIRWSRVQITPAVSLTVECEDQNGIGRFWPGMYEREEKRGTNCKRIDDRWGPSWQVVLKYIREVSVRSRYTLCTVASYQTFDAWLSKLVELEDRMKYNYVHIPMQEPMEMSNKSVIQDLLQVAEKCDSETADI